MTVAIIDETPSRSFLKRSIDRKKDLQWYFIPPDSDTAQSIMYSVNVHGAKMYGVSRGLFAIVRVGTGHY